MSALWWGISIDGAGAHPGAWRAAPPRSPAAWFDGSLVVAAAQRAEAGVFDVVMLDDALSLQDGDESFLRGRLDALLALAKAGPLTRHIGLVATVTTTHTEPFHLSKNLATLDWVSGGRAGWRVAVSTSADEADHFGRKGIEPLADLWDEAADAVEVVRRLWDSWEDGAIIRDRPTGRFIDRDKVHYIDFEGPRFAVRGPSIVPRSPQGQPLVVIDATDESAARVAAQAADIVVVDAAAPADAARRRADLRAAVATAGRAVDEVLVFARVEVVVGADALDRASALDAFAPWAATERRPRFIGSAAAFVDEATRWVGSVDGLLVVPSTLADDLEVLVGEVSPALVAAGLAAPPPRDGVTLRERFGLARPASRYATTGATS